MKTAFTTIFACIFTLILFAQTDELDGVWEGYITQDPGGLAQEYYFQVDLDILDEELVGTTTIRLLDKPDVYGIMNMHGKVTDEEISFEEDAILKQQIYTYAYWCLKEIQLKPVQLDGKTVLQGKWLSDRCPGTGEVTLEKTVLL